MDFTGGTTTNKVIVAAVAGGTASMLTGGKFMNGATTAAFVVLLNHVEHEQNRKIEEMLLKVADFLRYSPIIPYGPWLSPVPNPFLYAEAIFFDGGGEALGLEKDAGFYFILAGQDKGKFFTYLENSSPPWVSLEIGIGIEIGRVDYTGPLNLFNSDVLYGCRNKLWAGFLFGGTGLSWAKTEHGMVIGINTSYGFSLAPFYDVSAGFNKGTIAPLKQK